MLKSAIASFFAVASCLAAFTPAEAQRRGKPLADGVGKDLVEATCSACHPANRVTGSSGYTHGRR
jgi:cytochrome c5